MTENHSIKVVPWKAHKLNTLLVQTIKNEYNLMILQIVYSQTSRLMALTQTDRYRQTDTDRQTNRQKDR